MKSPIRFHINKANIPMLKVVLLFDLALVTTAATVLVLTRSPWSLLLLAPTLFPTFKVTKEEPSQ
jgi:hypothetical protein